MKLVDEILDILKEQRIKNLVFIAKTQKDFDKFSKVLEKSDFYAEEDERNLLFEFPEEEETLNALEKELQKLVDKNNIDGHFETN
jgi:hypothetical protein